MSKPIIAANWKMYPTLADSDVMIAQIINHASQLSALEVIIAPPSVWLTEVAEQIPPTLRMIRLAAQNIYWHDAGAYTGEISAYLIKDIAHYVIVGHSERRAMGESNDDTHLKTQAALRWRLKPILCVGESEMMFTANDKTIENQWAKGRLQIDSVIDFIKPHRYSDIIIAYEPIWAIGTGKSAKPDYANRAREQIRANLNRKYGPDSADIRLIYGGSVNEHNAIDYLTKAGFDGLLIGSESVKIQKFLSICQQVTAWQGK